MFIILPIGTDNPIRQKPRANQVIIVMNAVVFLAPLVLGLLGAGSVAELTMKFQQFRLMTVHPRLYEFITYAFLHANFMHIFGNMFFLYIFGNNVNSQLGNVGYVILYLGGAVFSALGHAMFNASPVLGASGAVAAITGAYMVLFPKTHIKVLYWFIYVIDTIEVPAIYFILFKLIFYDNVLEPAMSKGMTNVAHGAHLAGYSYGIALPLVMLSLKLLPHSQFDLWALLNRWRRRQAYRSMVGQAFDPFMGQPSGRQAVNVTVTDVASPSDPRQQAISELRAKIAAAANSANLADAANFYVQLIGMDGEQVLPQQQQLDIANKLMHTQQYAPAAKAYEDFISHYPRYPFLEQVQLMLGLLYSRYLKQPDDARKHLHACLEKLTDANQIQMAKGELERL